jgi:hypothetical protein
MAFTPYKSENKVYIITLIVAVVLTTGLLIWDYSGPLSYALELELTAIVVPTFVFAAWGLIGPDWWRSLMQRWIIWNDVDTQPLLPYNPYESYEKNLTGKIPKPPFKKRVKNYLKYSFWWLLVWVIILIIVISYTLATYF